ncbi:TMEM143 family protein [Pseudohalioglobus sediminis]|nr:TMEM143 family protein [Pseudohalioglobus sediminis]
MAEFPRLRFIPFRRSDLLQMCLADGALDKGKAEQFRQASERIEGHFQREFHGIKQQLKDAYGPLDPDADTRTVQGFRDQQAVDRLGETLERVLDRANYEKVSREQLQRAFDSASLFQLKLYVDLDDFEEALLYTRGATPSEEEVKHFFGLWRKTVKFIKFERVVLFIRFRDDVDTESTLGGCQPGSTMLKLFQNVPGADVEMLFPNTRVGMRLIDKLLIGVPALVSGGVVMTTKLGATLVLLGSLFGFWLGMHSDPVRLDKAAVLALLAGLGALGGYLWKQYSNFRNRKLRFTQALTENLYFKLLDNNAGVIFRVLDEAEESECKESLLAYRFLLAGDGPVSAAELDASIENWLLQNWQCRLDFEIDDALNKLEYLGLACRRGDVWQAMPADSSAA